MIRSIKHLCLVLHTKEEELLSILSNIDSFYYEKRTPKYKKNNERKMNKDGTPRDRVLNPSINELKAIQKRINKFLQQHIPNRDYIFGAAKKRDNVKNAMAHKGKKFVFQTDMQDFFPFVTHKDVYMMLCSYGFSYDVASKITKLTTYKGHLPQGTPTSSTLANLVFSMKAGDKLQQFAKEKGLTFTTFVDDVTISAPFDFKEHIQPILRLLRNCGFRISHTKTSYKTNHPEITGVKCGNNYLTTTDSFRSKLSDSSRKTEEQVKGLELYKEKIYKANKYRLKDLVKN